MCLAVRESGHLHDDEADSSAGQGTPGALLIDVAPLSYVDGMTFGYPDGLGYGASADRYENEPTDWDYWVETGMVDEVRRMDLADAYEYSQRSNALDALFVAGLLDLPAPVVSTRTTISPSDSRGTAMMSVRSHIDRIAIRPAEQRQRGCAAEHEAKAWADQSAGDDGRARDHRTAAGTYRYIAAYEHADMVCEDRSGILGRHSR